MCRSCDLTAGLFPPKILCKQVFFFNNIISKMNSNTDSDSDESVIFVAEQPPPKSNTFPCKDLYMKPNRLLVPDTQAPGTSGSKFFPDQKKSSQEVVPETGKLPREQPYLRFELKRNCKQFHINLNTCDISQCKLPTTNMTSTYEVHIKILKL